MQIQFDYWALQNANFTTSKEAYDLGETLRRPLDLKTSASIARLALGRSLNEAAPPEEISHVSQKIIRGHTLFGDRKELDLWIGFLTTNLLMTPLPHGTVIGLHEIQEAVRRHWHRGVLLLHAEWEQCDRDFHRFIEHLLHKANLPLKPRHSSPIPLASSAAGLAVSDQPISAVSLELGTRLGTADPIRWKVNGSGYSPHVALMGQSGSGKTRLLLQSLRQLRAQLPTVPMLVLDLGKGELVEDEALIRDLGAKTLSVGTQAVPLDMFYGASASENDMINAVQTFRESFEKVMRNKPGAKQLDHFREAIKPLFSQRSQIDLGQVRTALRMHYEAQGLETDSVMATLNDLTEQTLFTPQNPPADFFQQSWIVAFHKTQDMNRDLVALLLLDALNRFLKGLPAAPTNATGERELRFILAVDEARPLLAKRHRSLSEMIRLHRSKGFMTLLASQSPDDYDGEEDDYLENIGLPLAFRTNAQKTTVLKKMFKRQTDFSALAAGVCVAKCDGKTLEIQAFQESP